jgi:hypothetical protein
MNFFAFFLFNGRAGRDRGKEDVEAVANFTRISEDLIVVMDFAWSSRLVSFVRADVD